MVVVQDVEFCWCIHPFFFQNIKYKKNKKTKKQDQRKKNQSGKFYQFEVFFSLHGKRKNNNKKNKKNKKIMLEFLSSSFTEAQLCKLKKQLTSVRKNYQNPKKKEIKVFYRENGDFIYVPRFWAIKYIETFR